VSDIANIPHTSSGGGAPVGAGYLVAALDPGLSAEKVLQGTAGRVSVTAGAGTMTVDLVTTGVTPGSYSNTSLDVDAYGRLTGAANGAAGSYSAETAQDDVLGIIVDSATIDFSYNDPGNSFTGDVKDNSVGVAKMTSSATDRLFGRDTAAAGAGEELTVGGGVEFTGSGGIQRSALSGDISVAAGSNVTAIGTAKVTSAMLRDSAALSLIGRSANSSGVPADIAAANDGEIMRRSGTSIGFGSLTAAIDFIGSTRGAVLYRGASGWAILAPGTAGFLLKSGGAGADPSYAAYNPVVVALSDGANIATDAALGDLFTVTLGGNRTMDNPTNPVSGKRITYRITQDGTGSRTITWGSAFRGSTDVPLPTLTTTLNKIDYVAFQYNAADSKWDCMAVNKGF